MSAEPQADSLWGSHAPTHPTLRRYLSTISRPQLLHTYLPGGQTEPEAMDWGEDDGESGAEEEQESSSPAPSGFTCRNSRALAADPSSPSTSRQPTERGELPHGLSSNPRQSCPHPVLGVPRSARNPGAPPPRSPRHPATPLAPRAPPPRAPCPAQGAWGSPAGGRRTHQSFLPGAFAGPPGRQGCRPPALLRHEPRALRSESGEGRGETRVRSRR